MAQRLDVSKIHTRMFDFSKFELPEGFEIPGTQDSNESDNHSQTDVNDKKPENE